MVLFCAITHLAPVEKFYTNLDTQQRRSRKYGPSQGAAVGPVFSSVVFSDSGGAPVQRFSLRMETKTGF
jgi:hypothetical protein